MNRYKFKALQNLFPKSSFTELTEGGEIISSNPKLLKVTDAEIDAEIVKIKEEETKTQYQRDRLAEYPDLQECIHAILDDDLTALQAKRKLVKEKYPKPE
tara:strand:- start:43 stop:342 length:300 start_codon:yes stop_codon:yes gene_type:complete